MASTTAVVEALIREIRLLKVKLRIYEARIGEFERKYGVKSDEFVVKFEGGVR